MNINELIAIVKNKLQAEIVIQDLKIEDKSFYIKIIRATKRENFI